MNEVVVGVDGSKESTRAARWAGREAEARGAVLRIVAAAGPWATPAPEGGPAAGSSWPRENTRAAAQAAQDAAAGLTVREEVVGERPVKALLTAAREADMLVLGSRALGPVTGFVLGSVGLSVVAHATLPVVAVRDGEAGASAPVLVGVDVTHDCDPVLGFAYETARQHGVGVRVLHAWSVQHQYAYPSALPDPTAVDRAEAAAGRAVEEVLEPWRQRCPDVETRTVLALGAAAPFLLDESSSATLLVTGRRTRGHPFPTRIGPVTHAALHHAACPVAVVPHR
ncbi:universal stress protein [Streptomyces sp. NPDC007083]|uniref:universal stress protein n=1 Tax=unclassified Streptomyces TaxID=2593676 RepID=UPI0033D2F36E